METLNRLAEKKRVHRTLWEILLSLSLGHFQVASYRYRSLIEGLYKGLGFRV